MVAVDKANGYAFATLRGRNPYPPELLYVASDEGADVWRSMQVRGQGCGGHGGSPPWRGMCAGRAGVVGR